MKILQRYVSRTVLASIALVVLLLVGLQLFILLLKQTGDVGRGQYGVSEAIFNVILLLPQQLYLFFPVACLLGTLIGLGLLAQHSELIVMRASGLSVAQISVVVVKTALVLILMVTVVGEVYVPRINHFAEMRKASLISSGQALRTVRGVWARLHNRFIHIDTIPKREQLYGINEYLFDNSQHLIRARFAQRAQYHDGTWTLYNVVQTEMDGEKLSKRHYDSHKWQVSLDPKALMLSHLEPSEMTLGSLHRYIQAKQRSHNEVGRYQLNFWQRVFQPLASIVMMLLAIPFIFGPLRSSTMGARLLVGISAGFGFHLVNRFFGPLSLVYQLPPLLAALLPTLLFFSLALYLNLRTRR